MNAPNRDLNAVTELDALFLPKLMWRRHRWNQAHALARDWRR
jgi:hypothetical protein